MRHSAAVRRVFVFAACAAALLASFEDEAISTVASAAKDEISSQDPPDPADGFPDLFRDSASVDAGVVVRDRSEPVAVDPSVASRPDDADRLPSRDVTILFGVWRI